VAPPFIRGHSFFWASGTAYAAPVIASWRDEASLLFWTCHPPTGRPEVGAEQTESFSRKSGPRIFMPTGDVWWGSGLLRF
jgi:hypothetical protein